ncbi:MAG: hypothetical protein QOH55_1263 [Microbacteriaceae bacterium]|nr:hypothetical protein [Microbacteriaceae bacterium]
MSDTGWMSSDKQQQTMKPATAAKKLGIYLPATPKSFQSGDITRTELTSLLAEPPAWLADLRRNGPHPRDVVAGKLGVSISGLARGGITDPLTSAEITALLEAPPAWLVQERKTQADVRAEKQRVKARNAERAARQATN